MVVHRRALRWRTTIVACVLLPTAGALGWVVGRLSPSAAPPVLADEDRWPPTLEVNKLTEGDTEVGELLVNGRVVIQLRAPSKERTPYERVVVVVERLKLQIKPRDQMEVATGLRDGEHVVLVNDAALLTPLPGDLPEGMARREGARIWAEALASALGVKFVSPEEPRPWQPDEPYEDKIVPIVSFGKGKEIGAARVNGPETAVRQVQAVVQIESRMLNWFEVQIYVPISTKVPGETITRVQGVAVTAVGDLRL